MTGRPVSVIEVDGYRRRASQLLTAGQRDAVIDLIAYEPACGEVIQGSGGLRKVRIGRDGVGKRGGARAFTISTTRIFRFSSWRSMPKMKKAI
jgi:hypothetical protein